MVCRMKRESESSDIYGTFWETTLGKAGRLCNDEVKLNALEFPGYTVLMFPLRILCDISMQFA